VPDDGSSGSAEGVAMNREPARGRVWIGRALLAAITGVLSGVARALTDWWIQHVF
jgi:hypothetical protein